MKIAVASIDGSTVSPHFGRSACFLIYADEGGRVVRTETRPNTQTAFAQGVCKGEGESHHEHEHSHAGVVQALRDCDVVLCGGMGQRAAEELAANGIRPLIVEAASPQEAVEAFVAGRLRHKASFCRCQH